METAFSSTFSVAIMSRNWLLGERARYSLPLRLMIVSRMPRTVPGIRASSSGSGVIVAATSDGEAEGAADPSTAGSAVAPATAPCWADVASAAGVGGSGVGALLVPQAVRMRTGTSARARERNEDLEGFVGDVGIAPRTGRRLDHGRRLQPHVSARAQAPFWCARARTVRKGDRRRAAARDRSRPRPLRLRR